MASRFTTTPGGGVTVLEGPARGRLAARIPETARLYAHGGLDLNRAAPAVAIVGSRDATAAGVDAAREIGFQMAEAGWCVVSGAARGIDRAAHEGALEAGGTTVAVLGHTAAHLKDEPSLEWLRRAVERAFDDTVMITPFGPEVPQGKGMFAGRNRYIAALADACVVVEGRPQSGTLHTIEAARKLGVPLWAVGGTTPWAAVPTALVEQGLARLLRPWDAARMILGDGDAATAAAALKRRRRRRGRGGGAAARRGTRDLREAPPGPLRDALLQAPGGRLRLDDAVRILGVPIGTVLSEAGSLALAGFLSREGSLLVACKRATL